MKKENKKVKIILTGCLSKRNDVKRRVKDNVDIFMPIVELPFLNEKLKIKRNEEFCKDYLNIKPKYNSKFSAFVPIGNGCNNFCSYCVVPYARGREIYRPKKDILGEVKNLVKRGYKEIVLIAQNVNSYKDKGIKFSDLLQEVNKIEGDFWVRFATSHPKDMSDDLIKSIKKCEKVCKHIHLPAQSGDDEILKAMNRKYSSSHYKNLIKKIRKNIPTASITTDIIVGFSDEDEKKFNNTLKLFKEVKFDMAYIAQYSKRPGTASFKLEDDILKVEKKRRENSLMDVLKKTSLNNNKKYIGKIVKILVEGKNKKGFFFGKTETFKIVKIEDENNKIKIGEFIKVKIEKVEDFGLFGSFIK